MLQQIMLLGEHVERVGQIITEINCVGDLFRKGVEGLIKGNLKRMVG